jgi:hypothetical protein
MPLDSNPKTITPLNRQQVFKKYITDVQEIIEIFKEAQYHPYLNRFDEVNTLATLAEKVEGHYEDLTNSTQWLIGFPAISTVKETVKKRLETRKRRAELEERMAEIRKANLEVEKALSNYGDEQQRLRKLEGKLDTLASASGSKLRRES